MGLYDRDYYREEQAPAGFQLNQRMMVTNIVIVTAVVYLLNLFIGQENWLMYTLAIDASVLAKPLLWWKFVTYGLAHDPRYLGHVFWNMFGLWIFGRDVEMIYGRKEFLRIYLVALVLGSLVWCVREYFQSDLTDPPILLGASGAVSAIVLLFVFHYPKRTILLMLVLPIPAWVLGVVMIGGDLLQVLSGTTENVACDVHLVGAAFAICYYRFGWNCSRLLPGFGGVRAAASRLKPRPRLKIHDPEEYYRKKDEAADRVLEKVNREGMDCLTSKERRILEDYSRRMREKRR
jgi:membrane associated rhomboid family serine protease